jgi:hypothetical protein
MFCKKEELHQIGDGMKKENGKDASARRGEVEDQ